MRTATKAPQRLCLWQSLGKPPTLKHRYAVLRKKVGQKTFFWIREVFGGIVGIFDFCGLFGGDAVVFLCGVSNVPICRLLQISENIRYIAATPIQKSQPKPTFTTATSIKNRNPNQSSPQQPKKIPPKKRKVFAPLFEAPCIGASKAGEVKGEQPLPQTVVCEIPSVADRSRRHIPRRPQTATIKIKNRAKGARL